MKKMVPKDAVLIPKKASRVFQGVLFDVYQWPQKLYDGSTATFEMLRRSDTVISLCDLDGRILVVKEKQPGRGVKYTFPGGRVNSRESPLQAVKRETVEETGYRFANWRLSHIWQPFAKIEWFIYLYLAWDVANIGKPHLDGGERNTLQVLPIASLRALAKRYPRYFEESMNILHSIKGGNVQNIPEFTGKSVDISS